MPEINLLGSSQKSKGSVLQNLVPLLNKVFVVLLVLVMGIYGFLWYRGQADATATNQINDRIGQAQKALLNDPNRNELLTRQSQLRDLDSLTKNHFYWSILLKALPKMDLRSAVLESFTADSQGMATMVVSVSSYADLDKFLQVFNFDDVNKTFGDIQIRSVSKTEQDGVTAIKAKIQLRHRLDYLKNPTN